MRTVLVSFVLILGFLRIRDKILLCRFARTVKIALSFVFEQIKGCKEQFVPSRNDEFLYTPFAVIKKHPEPLKTQGVRRYVALC